MCPGTFIQRSSLHTCCSIPCAQAYAKRLRERKEAREAKADRKVTRERKEKLKSRSDYIKEVQIEFNKFIRIRDIDNSCISCPAPLKQESVGGGYDAGHFLSRGAKPHLRFDERNCHGQCKRCNRYLSGNIANYRERLIARIGIAEVEALEADNAPRHYTIDQLKELKKHYAQKCKDLVKLRESA